MRFLRRDRGIGFYLFVGSGEPFDPFDRLRAGRLRMWTLWPVR